MLRQVTTCCPSPHGHACRCCQATPPPPARNLPPHHDHHHHHHHHHHHRQEEGASRALAAAEAERRPNAGRHHVVAALNPAPPVAVAAAQVCWVPEPYLMVQQLREFESVNDEVVALRVQLQEYTEEIDRTLADLQGGPGGPWHTLRPSPPRTPPAISRGHGACCLAPRRAPVSPRPCHPDSSRAEQKATRRRSALRPSGLHSTAGSPPPALRPPLHRQPPAPASGAPQLHCSSLSPRLLSRAEQKATALGPPGSGLHSTAGLRLRRAAAPAGEVDRSKRDNSAGVDSWFHALPPNVRDVLVMARDTIESFVAISTAPGNH